jgi:NAD(P)-dependent dehydrogenase (short-subunit alcohol dehydrogenase family)
MILVTGASQGIGREVARAFLERTGSRVLITARREEGLARAREGMPALLRDRLDTVVCDQEDRRQVEGLSRAITASPATLEYVVLNVGVNPMYTEGPQRLHALGADTIESTIRTNCAHVMLLTAAVLDRFRRQRRGVLIWIGSMASWYGLPGAALYSATKSFLSGLARTAHREYSARGIRVHLAHPGPVRTPRTAAVVDGFAAKLGLEVKEPSLVADRIVGLAIDGADDSVEVDL